ncbi:transcription factor GTE4-like protein isoform X1 [Tanacetum coccineum]
MQLIQKLRDDQKRIKKAFEDVSRSYEQKSNQDRDHRFQKEGTLLLGNRDRGNEVVKQLVVMVDGGVKIDLKVYSGNGRVEGRGLVRMGAEMRNDFIDKRAVMLIVMDVVDRRALMRTNSKIGLVTNSDMSPYQPYQHLSASVVDNNHYGVGEYVEKEKRMLKANQYYQNSNIKMLKGIFVEVKKKSETAVRVLCQEKITIDPKDHAAVDQYAKFMKTVRQKPKIGKRKLDGQVEVREARDFVGSSRDFLDLKSSCECILSSRDGAWREDASSEEDSEDVVDEGVVEKPMKVNPPRISPDGSKKRVPKADASPPVPVTHSPP